MELDLQQVVHGAIQADLADGEIALAWILVVDTVDARGNRRLAHRAGGGMDGSDRPVAWTALGMMRAAAALAEEQVVDNSYEAGEDDEPDEPAS
jgi:hypothetical protein